MERLRTRLYPETLDSLGYYWLKTVFASGYGRDEWDTLDRLLEQAQAAAKPGGQQMLQEIRTRIRRAGLRTREGSSRSDANTDQVKRPGPSALALRPYTLRLLNEWAPVEVARLLVRDADGTGAEERGIPAVAFGKALERLIVRERLSEATLDPLLQPRFFDPRYVYPADVEVLKDVILYMLGRTSAPAPDILPATLLCVAPESHLPADYAEDVARAFLDDGDPDALNVPISPAEALQAITGEQVRITSVVVTIDGRWWQADRLRGGPGSAVVYRPMGRLTMDYSSEHVRVRVPWPEARWHWSGSVSFAAPLEIFGRTWHVAHWEQDAERTWLDLEFAAVLPIAPSPSHSPDAGPILRRSRPAYVDMAWTALENALAESVTLGNTERVEQMRREELIGLGRALHTLCESVIDRRTRNVETLEARLRAIAYHAAEIEPAFGKAPWRVLPEPVRKIMLRHKLYTALADPLRQVFDGLPDQERGRKSADHAAASRVEAV